MKPTQKLELRQGQSLVMTAQLQQSIKLLQLSSAELMAFVEEEMERNPLLAAEESAPSDTPEAPETQADMGGEGADMSGGESVLDSNYGDGWQSNEEGSDYQVSRLSVDRHERSTHSGSYDGEATSLEQTLSSDITLRDHVLSQLQVDIEDPKMRMVAVQLLDRLDEVGYLREETTQLAEQLGADEALIEATIARMQQFDPVGIFARNLKECLSIQLKERDWYDPMMQAMIEHIHLMEKGDLQGLQARCGASAEDFQDMLKQIRTLNPYPARQFIHDLAQPVIPDVFVRGGKDGQWQIELNHDALPRVLLDQHYYQELDTRTRDKGERKYLSEQLNQANWLVKALDQRAQTILKVSSEIVKQQENFLLYGIQFLKPLTLKDIALQVDLHESTISRVTTNKFMATPRGIFELKYFFTSSVGSASGADDVSSKTVMYYIKELIDAESPSAILSDDTIVTMLKDKNIDIARRTVAKYRESLNIPSSVARRKFKNSVFS